MARTDIDTRNLKVTGAHRASADNNGVVVQDDVVVIVTQAFGPTGESLMSSEATFDGQPSVTLRVKGAGREGLVHLSPFHGDRRKTGFLDFPPGTKCELYCPISGKRLDFVGRVSPDSPADFYAIYLTKRLSEGEMVAISDVWGDYHSRIVDNFELISSWAADSE